MRLSVSRLKNEHGFSVTELMIAAGIGIIVLLALAGGMTMVAKANKKAQVDSLDIAEMATVGVAFPAFVQQARPSVDFMHMPVNRDCGGNDAVPCLRMEVNGAFEELDSATAGKISATTVEFFRDHNGRLRNDMKVSKAQANTSAANLTYTNGLNLSKLPSGHTVYATWPFIDENSAPFLMLTSNTVAKFSVPGYTALSNANPTDWLFLKLDSGMITDVTKLKDMPMAFVNTGDNRQYVIKYVVDVHSCGDSSWTSMCNTKAGNPAYVSANDVVIKYDTILPSDLAALTATGVTPPSDGSFDSGFSSLSYFPNISNTVVDEEAIYFSGTNFDPRRLLHYYHSSGISGSLAALPLAFMSMRVIRDGSGKLNLVRDLYRHGQAPIRGDVSSDLKGPALIARKLGSQELKLILFDSSPSP